MSNLRYFYAFLLSTLIFTVLLFLFNSLVDIKKKIKPIQKKVIKIALITPIQQEVKPPLIQNIPTPLLTPILPLPMVKKIIRKKIVRKIKPKKIVRKKIVRKIKPKKIVRKKIVRKQIIKRVIPQPIIQSYIPVAPPIYQAPKPIIKPVLKATAIPKAQVKNNHHKKAFLRTVRSNIVSNKKYPKLAKRRHIEGSVKVRFNITRQGNVSNIRFINGKRIFQKSIRKTLERSFPMNIPSNVRNELPILDISIILHFNIR